MVPTRQSEEREDDPPVDNYHLVYFAFLAIGVGFLLPWTTLTSAADYFLTIYPGSDVMFGLSLTYFVSIWVTVLISMFTVECFDYATKARFGFIIINLSLIYILFVETGFRPLSVQVSYKVLLFVGFVTSSATSIVQTNAYGLSSILPHKYSQATMTGESVAGIFSFALRLITKASISSLHINTVTYMGISLLLSVTCFILFNVVLKSEFVRYHVFRRNLATEDENVVRPTDWGENMEPSETEILNQPADSYGTEIDRGINSNQDKSRCQTLKEAMRKRFQIIRVIWPYMLPFWCCYFVTLSVFPGVITQVNSCSLGTWMPVLMVGLFNVFDFIGKNFVLIHYDWPKIWLNLCTVSRIILVPLTIMCATPRPYPYIGGDALPLLFVSLVGLSNGYFGSVPIVLAPLKVQIQNRELAGNIMVFALVTGLLSGSSIGYAYLDFIEPLNPDISYCGNLNQTSSG